LAGLERTHEVLSERPEDKDPRRTVELPDLEGRIAFEHVSFSYDGNRTVLHDVSFQAQPGTVTALVGSSGSGKSTTIGLVSAFYVPSAGKISVDEVDLSTVRLDSYRTRLGVVLQESFLFDGTIRENVAFSKPHATEDEIMRACQIARVDEFAESFDEKYDTVVGERGVKLSGGQRQRISIARAILAEPRILILDEATSSLDSESEALIQQGLSYLMQGRTTFVIAHRLSHNPPCRPDSRDGAGKESSSAPRTKSSMPCAAAITTCTRGSMASKATCFWLPERAISSRPKLMPSAMERKTSKRRMPCV
jgi:subfamily B ATP-binding cassette protein MsbA